MEGIDSFEPVVLGAVVVVALLEPEEDEEVLFPSVCWLLFAMTSAIPVTVKATEINSNTTNTARNILAFLTQNAGILILAIRSCFFLTSSFSFELAIV